jgi:hypothetical protein
VERLGKAMEEACRKADEKRANGIESVAGSTEAKET